MPPKKRTRQQRRRKVTRQQLLAAAREVFAERGLDLTRIDEITERADVGKGTFYYHFKSKGKLVSELIGDTLSQLVASIEERCADVKGLEELLDALISAHIEFFSKRWEDFVLFFQGRADLALQEGYTGLEKPFVRYLERIEALLDAEIRSQVPDTVLRRIACAVAGFLSGYYSFAAISSENEDVDQAFRELRGSLVAALSRFIKVQVPAIRTA